MFGAIQDAAIAALSLPAERIAQLTAVYHQRREWVLRRLAALRWPVRAAQGTFFLWLSVPPGYRSQEFARLLLQEAHILVAPGTGFGDGGEGFIRISLTAGDDALSKALDRLARLALFSARLAESLHLQVARHALNTRGGIVIAGAGGFTQYAIFGAIVKGGLILLFQKAPGDGVAENTVAIRLRLIAAGFDALHATPIGLWS